MDADARETAARDSSHFAGGRLPPEDDRADDPASDRSREPRSHHAPDLSGGASSTMTSDEEESSAEGATSPAEALHAAKVHFAELREYLSYYVAAKSDAFKASFRNLGLMIGLGMLGLMLGGAFVITAAVLLLNGLAGGVGALFNRPWLGQLIVGFVLVAGIGGGAFWFYSRATRAAREKTVKKYESRKRKQRDQFRTDVTERAQDAHQ
jgi:hypothetical protein